MENPDLFIPLIKNKYSILKGKITIEDEKNDLKKENLIYNMNNKEYKFVLDLRGNFGNENKFRSKWPE